MSGRIAMIISLGSLLTCGTAFGASMCKIVPSCESLGYTMSESECATSVGYPITTLKCPFDNSMVYCPEDCLTYPIIGESCDQTKGNCVRCALSNRWKYISCNLDEGYILEEGRCQPKPCDPSIYVYNDDNKPDTSKGRIVTCKSAGEMRYGYSECSEGWDLKGADCVDHECGEDYVIVGKTCTDGECITKCPDFGVCKDYCYSGTTEKVNFTCVEGLVRQGVKCVRHKVGSIAHYCPNRKEIISDPDKLTDDCGPIGVVFWDNGVNTRIIALHDIDKEGKPVLKQNSASSKMGWATNVAGSDIQCQNYDIETIENTRTDMDGFGNTQKIIDFADWYDDEAVSRCWTWAAKAAYRYYPDICDEGSLCGLGLWYLPAVNELSRIYEYYKEGKSTAIYDALNNSDNGAFPMSTDWYWSSSEVGPTAAWRFAFFSGAYGGDGKTTQVNHVRPVLMVGE